MLQMLLGPVANIAGQFLENRREKSRANNELKITKVKAETELLQKKVAGTVDWDLEMAKASSTSWKDEWLTILFSIPLVLCFCGEWGRDIVREGFVALSGMPDFYQMTLGVIVAASFGFRGAAKFWGK